MYAYANYDSGIDQYEGDNGWPPEVDWYAGVGDMAEDWDAELDEAEV